MASWQDRIPKDVDRGPPKPGRVRTWMSPGGFDINLTEKHEERFKSAGFWPMDPRGEEYSDISSEWHWGMPTFSDFEVESFIDTQVHGL